MSSPEERFHEMWMGMVQPIEGLVVSMPVLLESQVGVRHPAALHERFKQHLVVPKKRKNADAGAPTLRDLRKLAADVLEIDDGLRDDSPPDDLSIYLTEGRERIAPTWAVRNPSPIGDALTARYQLLTWELPSDVDLDKPDTRDGVWAYPPRAKFERMLRHAGVPIGLLANGRVIRLVYAPQGESSGWVSFRVADMAKVEGRPILDALIMLLHARRFEGAAAGTSLPELLAKSRRVQAEVSKELQGQVRRALETLLRGFEEAAERDGAELLNEAYAEGSLYYGLLTVLLRLVFVLFAEDRELLPIEHPLYRGGLSIAGLFERLQEDAARYPDSMSRRFGAYVRLIALFRAVYLGVHHGDLSMPARRGDLFSPHTYPFLEGWGSAGGAPISLAEERAKVAIPTVDDGCVFEVLRSLLYLKRERLSYRALDVEQIGSVYEGLIGFVAKKTASPAVRLGDPGTWVEVDELLAEKPAARAKWLEEKTGLSASKCKEIAQAVAGAKGSKSASDELAAFVDTEDAVGALRFVLQPVVDHNDTQYTPRSLSEPIVETTLRPLLTAMGEAPSSERILSLKVCDPAMGSGAFLVAACRFLGSELISAWTREGVAPALAAAHGGDLVVHARRTVAQKCLYGVDKNPFAVNLGKLSLWLATLAKNESFTFLDHALRCGDSLVGLSLEQIEHFTWEPVAPTTQARLGQLDLFEDEIANALRDALVSRQSIEQLASEGTADAVRERERLLDDATDALARVRLIGDVVVGAFFAHESDRDRSAELAARERQVRAWLSTRGPIPDALALMAAQARSSLRPFHWAVEFPEIFFLDRQDPLEDGAVNRAASMDAFIGNPPFSGKNGIIDAGGPAYLPWLQAIHTGAHGNADLVAHFFRRTESLLGKHGTIGLIATKTIAQGDTRATALQPLVASGLVIYEATRRMPWPGEAKVHVSVVHLAKGSVVGMVPTRRLDKKEVIMINSRLRAGEERPDPVPLEANSDKSFVGSYVLGMGFVLTPDERDALIKKNKKNAERIFPFLGGEEVNTSPVQAFDRFVINFDQLGIVEAERWPDLFAILREKVKPERDKQKDAHGKKHWWQFMRTRPELYSAIAPLQRCLVTAIVSKHLMFSFQPTSRVFSHKLSVFPFDDYANFAVLQSRVHVVWTWLLSSTMKGDLNYSASDCFETFPFPDKRAALEGPGRAFYDARAAYMKDHDVGLTVTYNRMRDAENHDIEIEQLRKRTVAMDEAVLAAYGWSDLGAPPYPSPVNEDEKRTLAAFEDAVVDRLFALNTKRGAGQSKKSKKR